MPLPLIEALGAGNSEATLIFTKHKGFCMARRHALLDARI